MFHAALIVAFLFSVVPVCRGGEGRVRLHGSAVIGKGSWLLAVQDVAAMPDGGLLVSDKLDYRVKKFAADGKQVATVGGRGRGPGQFLGPGPIDCSKKRIAVADFASNRIQCFTCDFVYLRTLRVEGAVSDLCFDGSGRLWVVAVTLDAKRTLFQFDDDGATRKTLQLRNAKGDLFADAGFVSWLGGGRLAVSYFVQNKIEIWDTSGVLSREFSVPGLPAMSPVRKLGEAGDGIQVPEGNIFRGMSSNKSGVLCLLVGDYGEYPERELIMMNEEGQVMQRLLLPDTVVQITGVDSVIYAVKRDRNSVRMYAVPGVTKK